MLKFIRAEIALGFQLATIFWIAVLAWQASYSPTERQKEECYEVAKKTGYKADECKSFWEKTTSDPIALFNLILAFSTVGLWVATISLNRTGNNQIKLAREEFNATHRPKIRVHAAELKRTPPRVKANETDEYDRIAASLICFNVGESNAVRIEVRGEIFAGTNFAIDVQRPVVATFAEVISGQKLRAEIASDIPVVQVAAGKRNGIDYHCLGWIAYYDQNGLRRETAFCFKADMWAKPRERWVSAEKPEHEYEY